MKIFLTALFLLINIISFSQTTIEELEHELSFYKSGEKWGNKKNIAYKLLEIDSLNASAINYLFNVYGRNNQRDSINILFKKITQSNPNSPDPYLLIVRDRNAYFAGLTDTQKIEYLKKAKEIDNENYEATYMLGKTYYELFINEYNNNNKSDKLGYYAKNSIQYFSELCEYNENSKETLKFPLIQLTNYIGDENQLIQYENYNVQSSYFPVESFLVLPNNWKTNYTVNVLNFVSGSDFNYYGVESAFFSINWYSKHLLALEEPILIDSYPSKIYRFTYLRTFDNPIIIRIENNNNIISIYWKVSDGAGGYEPGKIIESNEKELTIDDWERIEQKINSIKYWSLPTVEKELLGTDGSQWILEGKKSSKYHVVDRWCGGEIFRVCNELIKLTDLKINQDDIY